MEKTLQEIIDLIKPDIRVRVFNEHYDGCLSDDVHGGDKLDWDASMLYVVEWLRYDRKENVVDIGIDLKL